MNQFSGWTPFRAAWQTGELVVDWCHLGDKRFTEPFFYETISLVIGHPFNQAFRPRTRADDLLALSPGLPLAGFVFHMSRCGSTLVAQALAADPANIVLSEALSIRAALWAPHVAPIDPARADRWLAGIVGALGRRRFAQEERVIVKFMAADVLDIATVTRVFPEVPWLFVYRDPLEVLASTLRLAGTDTMPRMIDPARLGLAPAALATMSHETYVLHALAAFCRAAGEALGKPGSRGLALRYEDVPAALASRIPAHFGFTPTPDAHAAIAAATMRDAKAPGRVFVPDAAEKRREAAGWTEAAARIAGPAVAALDDNRGMLTG